MVHLRARNLPSKGKVVEWLFKGENISFGDDFALVKLDDGGEVNIKSNYNGVIVKTIKLGSPVKNGSILANIAIGEKEIAKFRNRHFTRENVEEGNIDGIFLPDYIEETNMPVVDSPADEFSGAVVYDRYNQAITPFSSGHDDIMDSKEKFEKLEEKEKTMQDSPVKDRFAQMRANIQNSIKNAPQNKVMGDMNPDELLKMNNNDLMASTGGNIFEKQDGVGPSKFRQLIQARKEKLLEENDYKEVKDVDQSIDAMSKTDEKGRPLIMRNIIASRIEKLNQAGGDPSVLERDIVATKDNALLDKDKPKPSLEAKPMSKPEQNSNWEQRGSKNLEVTQDEVFMRQRASEDGDFGVSLGGYIVDEEPTVIDANDLSKYGGFVMPQKKPDELLEEINSKGKQSYAESKIKSLYDINKRWNLMKDRDERTEITNRRKAIESGQIREVSKFEQTVEQDKIPKQFTQEVPYQDDVTGEMQFIPYNKTPRGKKEFESWLRASNLYTSYLEAEHDAEREGRELDMGGHKTPKKVQKQISKKLNEQGEEYATISGDKEDDTIDFLKKQIADLQDALIQQNKLNEASQRVGQQTQMGAGGGTDTFSQLMQYMLMQSIMQNMSLGGDKISGKEIKDLIRSEIESFKKEVKTPSKNYDEMRTVNFENQVQDANLGYLDYESNDVNKEVRREKVNKTRNPAVKSMILSQNYIPPLTISTEIDMSSILKLKHMLKQTQNHIKFSTISFIAKAISIALEEHPKINSSYDPESDEVIIKKYHNIGLATETSEGLIIPVLKFVEKLSVKEVAIDIREMTQRLRAGELYNYETEGSTITIANYGNIGAIQATPTIFYPNAAVIGVGKVVKKPVVVNNEKLAIKAIMNMSLTVDQRILDAAEAGRFLSRVKEILERPEVLTVS
ncbi:2-oxo acid dehydrogenase subunit E2 [Spiroplasma chinense]|nr:2-oxo acid dehydrogenase subunit E2 [Spiroplasma chinense]